MELFDIVRQAQGGHAIANMARAFNLTPEQAAAATGGGLFNIIRSILGSALGFSTKGGVMGWIFRAVILRYGWSILRAIFGGILGRR